MLSRMVVECSCHLMCLGPVSSCMYIRVISDDDVDGHCHSFCLAMLDIPSKQQHQDPQFQIHGTIATANSGDWVDWLNCARLMNRTDPQDNELYLGRRWTFLSRKMITYFV